MPQNTERSQRDPPHHPLTHSFILLGCPPEAGPLGAHWVPCPLLHPGVVRPEQLRAQSCRGGPPHLRIISPGCDRRPGGVLGSSWGWRKTVLRLCPPWPAASRCPAGLGICFCLDWGRGVVCILGVLVACVPGATAPVGGGPMPAGAGVLAWGVSARLGNAPHRRPCPHLQGRPSLRAPPPPRPRASVWRTKRPICFHSESLKIPFWRNEKRKARFPRAARWVPARARRCAGVGWGRGPASPPLARPPPPAATARVRAAAWPASSA